MEALHDASATLRPPGCHTRRRLRSFLERRVIATLVGASVVLLAATSRRADAQVSVNYGTGVYGQYRRDLVRFAERSQALIDEIRAIEVRSTYCTEAERNLPGRALAEVRVKLGDLDRDWNDFKFRMRGLFATASVYAQFAAAGEDPGNPNFWTRSDRIIIGHPAADREAKVAIHGKSRVIDCSPPRQQPRAEPARPVAADPLGGLTRPAVPPRAAPPQAPAPFCNVVDRINWIKTTLDPLMAPLLDASFALNNYGVDVANARDAARARGDANAERGLTTELDWVAVNHNDVDARYWELARLRDATTVIDCREPSDKKFGLAPTIQWRLGAALEYAQFGNFERTAGQQDDLTSVDGSSGGVGYGLSVGAQGHRWEAGVSVHWNKLDLTQTYAPMPNGPARVEGSVNGTFVDLSLGPRLTLGRRSVWTFAGATWAINSYDFLAEDAGGATWEDSRSLKTWKGHGGIVLEQPFGDRFGVRLGGTYTSSGKSDDADTNWRALFGTTLRF